MKQSQIKKTTERCKEDKFDDFEILINKRTSQKYIHKEEGPKLNKIKAKPAYWTNEFSEYLAADRQDYK